MIPNTNKYLREAVVYFFFVLITLILLYPVIFTREKTFFIIGDNLHLAYPFMNKLAISLHKGYLPTWDANTFGGKNLPGEFQSATFYPPNIICCWLFGSEKGIATYYLDLLVCLHYLACLIGMYKLAKLLAMPDLAAIGAALTFTFTGVLAFRSGCEAHIFHGLTLIPWVLYGVFRYYLQGHKKIWLIWAGVFSGLQILAGHMQPYFHTVLMAAIIIAYYEIRGRKNKLQPILNIGVSLAILVAVGMLIALPQMYYAAEYMSRCYREVGFNHLFIAPGQKVPLFVLLYQYILTPADFENYVGEKSVLPQDFNFLYMGILALALCIIFLIRKKALSISTEHQRLTQLLLIIGLFGICCVLGYLTFLPYLLYEIPFVNTVRQMARYVILIGFSSSLLVGLAITYLPQLWAIEFSRSTKWKIAALLALTLNTLYWIILQADYIDLNVSVPYFMTTGFLTILLTIKPDKFIRFLAVGLICIDLLLNPVFTSLSHSYLYPDYFYARNRIVNFLEKSYGKYRVTIDMHVWINTRRNIGDVYNIQTKYGYAGSVNAAYYNFINHGHSATIDDLLNIKYEITDKILDSNFIFQDSTRGLNLYQRKNCYPRCYWMHQVGEAGAEIEKENAASISQLSYSDLDQMWAIGCQRSDTLIFSENIYPGWGCTDNGKEIPIITAPILQYPALFRMIVLSPGHHRIEFRYHKPFYWF